jgi:hypothetical protein
VNNTVDFSDIYAFVSGIAASNFTRSEMAFKISVLLFEFSCADLLLGFPSR